LTLDCYGTLVDWETGLATALRQVFDASDEVTDDALLGAYARAEASAEAGPFRVYKEVLRAALAGVAREFGRGIADAGALVKSLPAWPLFPDTRGALERLGKRFRLCVVSNVDLDLFERTRHRIGVKLDEVVTADQIQSYKPAPAHFREALARLGLPAERVVHVAQSLYHDIAPAAGLGLRAVWVDRREGRRGGATKAPDGAVAPSLRVKNLTQLADRVDAAFAE
jgi:2-haloacid dehalogenase